MSAKGVIPKTKQAILDQLSDGPDKARLTAEWQRKADELAASKADFMNGTPRIVTTKKGARLVRVGRIYFSKESYARFKAEQSTVENLVNSL